VALHRAVGGLGSASPQTAAEGELVQPGRRGVWPTPTMARVRMRGGCRVEWLVEPLEVCGRRLSRGCHLPNAPHDSQAQKLVTCGAPLHYCPQASHWPHISIDCISIDCSHLERAWRRAKTSGAAATSKHERAGGWLAGNKRLAAGPPHTPLTHPRLLPHARRRNGRSAHAAVPLWHRQWPQPGVSSWQR
jgi:hypothetical protein